MVLTTGVVAAVLAPVLCSVVASDDPAVETEDVASVLLTTGVVAAVLASVLS